jgi:hypothetical protein
MVSWPARDQAVLQVGYISPAHLLLLGRSLSQMQLTLSLGDKLLHENKHKTPAASTPLYSVGNSNFNEYADDRPQPTQMR